LLPVDFGFLGEFAGEGFVGDELVAGFLGAFQAFVAFDGAE
jgi:hypothetical protein